MPSTIAVPPSRSTPDEWVPMVRARQLLGGAGGPIGKHAVLSLGLQGEIDVRMFAGRFCVQLASIRDYRARHGLGALPQRAA